MNPSDRRDTRRVILGPTHAVRFDLKGHAFEDVRITNISEGGCFLMVGKRDVQLFNKDALLENLVVRHETLPSDPITGQVVYALGTGGPQMEFVGIGVRFLELPTSVHERLLAFVAEQLGPLQG